MRCIRLAVVITALLGAGSASAAGVGIRAGTTGIGGDVAFELVPTLSARFGYSWLNFNTSVDSTDVNYDAKRSYPTATCSSTGRRWVRCSA